MQSRQKAPSAFNRRVSPLVSSALRRQFDGWMAGGFFLKLNFAISADATGVRRWKFGLPPSRPRSPLRDSFSWASIFPRIVWRKSVEDAIVAVMRRARGMKRGKARGRALFYYSAPRNLMRASLTKAFSPSELIDRLEVAFCSRSMVWPSFQYQWRLNEPEKLAWASYLILILLLWALITVIAFFMMRNRERRAQLLA